MHSATGDQIIKGFDLKPHYVLRWGDTLPTGEIADQNCVWVGQGQRTQPVPLLLDGLRGNVVGHASLSVDRCGVTSYPTVYDACQILRHAHKLNFEVRWKPGVSVDATELREDGILYATRARIDAIALIPMTTALPSARIPTMRLLESGT